ncbi:MAG: FG-GAP repeat protein [Planctomycetes bacterium]|nr:FG-GAP repeat protein [Planctomycetota bacterium]MBI3833851.1 FG-GAP repeat protein [Planctomycetota bacterium]
MFQVDRLARKGVRIPAILAAIGGLGCIGLILVSCTTAPTAFLVNGPSQTGNTPPTMTITEPIADITRGQGDPFLIKWIDADPDDNAKISFSLVDSTTNATVALVQGISEDDQIGPDSFPVPTQLIPIGTYNILGTIDDTHNPAVQVFAMTSSTSATRVVVRIVGQGEGQQTQPPVVVVTAPTFDLSVTQDDILTIQVQPVAVQPPAPSPPVPFDRDSDTLLYVLLDTDEDPTNDDPANPDPAKIVVLQTQTITKGATSIPAFQIPIDLNLVPPLSNGAPYFIRATITDATNTAVSSYAPGTISVVQLAAGTVDLSAVGRSTSGATLLGFNPSANLGSSIAGVRDFDLDGTDDFLFAAQHGNPRNAGLVGEAYLIYGQNGIRLGGVINVNSVGATVPGVIFEAPPVRTFPQFGGGCRITGRGTSDGITDVSFVPDLTGDGRPELLFGLAHVEGAWDSTDFDPSDEDTTSSSGGQKIEVVFRQGQVTVKQGDNGTPVVISTTYSSMLDTALDSALPGSSFGNVQALSWKDGGVNHRQWALLKFGNILELLPDPPQAIDFTTLQAKLRVRVFNTGGNGSVHTLLTDFSEQTTFSDFAVNGGEPQGGVDYIGDANGGQALGAIDATNAASIDVDVSGYIAQLIDGQLDGFNNEMRFIVLPGTGLTDDAAVRSSEYSIGSDRPQLVIDYTRINLFGGVGCFPDSLVNNLTDSTTSDQYDVQWYGGGMAAIVNSQNRDNSGGVASATRLEKTAVALELVGQRVPFPLGVSDVDKAGGNIFVRADNNSADVLGNDTAEPGRIAGARMIGGPYDCVDARQLSQPAREDSFAQNVTGLGDVNNDGLPEIMISSPTNEKYLKDLSDTYGLQSTQEASTRFRGSITVIPGTNYNNTFWRDIADSNTGTSTIPFLDQHVYPPFGQCNPPAVARHNFAPADTFEVFAENINDRLGGARSAGDFNLDGIDDIICGAPLNDRSGAPDAGAVYVLYCRTVLSDFDLKNADSPTLRTPMLRIRGEKPGDQIGWRQASGLDVNGDRIDDVFFSSPRTDFGGISRSTCAKDFNGDGSVDTNDLSLANFNSCVQNFGTEVFTDDPCKAFDYDNDGDIDDDDRCVFCCLSGSCNVEQTCVNGHNKADCCENLVDNGFAAVVFGGRTIDGDRDISQIATSELPGVIFFGGRAGDRAGIDVSSAGDFNQDGFGDILIAVPGEVRIDDAGRQRLGVVYLIFGGTHLNNTRWNLSDKNRGVGSADLPGIVFLSPFVMGRPNEAAPSTVGFLGDINNDGFGDIAIGNPKADFIDLTYPQGPDAPGSDASAGRRSDAGNIYIVYGNNFGSNRAIRP